MSAIPRPFTLMGTGSGGSPTFATGTFTSGVVLTSAATAGLQLYNTADQTTNYERLEALWSSNVATLRARAAGSGTARTFTLSAANASGIDIGSVSLRPLNDASGSVQISAGSTGSTTAVAARVFLTSTATSGTIGAFHITPTYNQASGTAANTDLLVNRTQTAVGSGAQLLADFQVGGVSQFNVSNNGSVTVVGSFLSSGNVRAGSASAFFWSGRSVMRSPSDGVVTLLDTAETSFGRLQFGGTTNSFPALKRSTTTLQVRLADDSADAGITMAGATLSGALITTPQALSGAGAVNTTTTVTEYTSTGAAQALTLANGTVGQLKEIIHVVDGGSGVLTPTTASGFTTITFTNAGESAVLKYGSAGWVILSLRGAVAA